MMAYQVWEAVCSSRSSLNWYPSGHSTSQPWPGWVHSASTSTQSLVFGLSDWKKKNKIKEMREKEIPGKVNISENDGCLLFRFNFIWTIWVGYSRAARWLNMPSECGQCLGHALCSRHPKNYSWPSFSLPITAGCPYITFSHWPVTDS